MSTRTWTLLLTGPHQRDPFGSAKQSSQPGGTEVHDSSDIPLQTRRDQPIISAYHATPHRTSSKRSPPAQPPCDAPGLRPQSGREVIAPSSDRGAGQSRRGEGTLGHAGPTCAAIYGGLAGHAVDGTPGASRSARVRRRAPRRPTHACYIAFLRCVLASGLPVFGLGVRQRSGCGAGSYRPVLLAWLIRRLCQLFLKRFASSSQTLFILDWWFCALHAIDPYRGLVAPHFVRR